MKINGAQDNTARPILAVPSENYIRDRCNVFGGLGLETSGGDINGTDMNILKAVDRQP